MPTPMVSSRCMSCARTTAYELMHILHDGHAAIDANADGELALHELRAHYGV